MPSVPARSAFTSICNHWADPHTVMEHIATILLATRPLPTSMSMSPVPLHKRSRLGGMMKRIPSSPTDHSSLRKWQPTGASQLTRSTCFNSICAVLEDMQDHTDGKRPPDQLQPAAYKGTTMSLISFLLICGAMTVYMRWMGRHSAVWITVPWRMR